MVQVGVFFLFDVNGEFVIECGFVVCELVGVVMIESDENGDDDDDDLLDGQFVCVVVLVVKFMKGLYFEWLMLCLNVYCMVVVVVVFVQQLYVVFVVFVYWLLVGEYGYSIDGSVFDVMFCDYFYILMKYVLELDDDFVFMMC